MGDQFWKVFATAWVKNTGPESVCCSLNLPQTLVSHVPKQVNLSKFQFLFGKRRRIVAPI